MSRGMVPGFRAALLGITILALTSPNVFAADSSAPPNDPCLRPSAGSVVSRPPDLFSRDGVLNVAFEYVTTLDDAGRTLFCFRTPDGLTSPTLHVKPAIARSKSSKEGSGSGPQHFIAFSFDLADLA